MNKLPPNFCFKPWVEVFSHFDTLGPCCVNYDLFKGSIKDYNDSEELKQLKKDFLLGKKPTACYDCWQAEANGIKSVRQIDNLERGKSLKTISISLSNKCNFKCRMCNPEDSSAWALDKNACDVLDWHDVPTNTNLSTVDYILEIIKKQKMNIRIMGGEPLITDEFIYFLNQVDNHKLYDNVYLILTTNLSVLSYKNINYLDYFSKFKELDIFASLDGVGLVGEYIRHGFVFSKFDNNLKLANKYIKSLSVTLTMYNIFDMPNIFAYAEKNNLPITFNYMVDPSFLRVENLSMTDRKAVLKHYDEKNFYNEQLDSLLSSTMILNEKPRFLQFTNDLDLLWDKDLLQSIPELKILV